MVKHYIKMFIIWLSDSTMLKLDWCDDDEAASLKSLLETSLDTTPPTSPAVTSPPRKRVKMFSFISAPKPSSTLGTVDSEMSKYLEEPCLAADSNPLEYWRSHRDSYPRLAKLAEKHLGVVSSSAPVERAFSVAGKIFRPDRCKMNDENFETVMFIKCNHNAL
jgi:hypothetical protein